MTDHGTPQFPRVEVDPIGQEMQSIALKSGCFDRSPDKMMKGFPGAAGPRKGADQTVAGLFRCLPRRSEARRVGKECASTCRSRCSQSLYNTKLRHTTQKHKLT